ncbi:MAG: inositol monophosphatase [Chloroflexi bacterium]|nr:inositol monophosphatase [Chloroflexota bacterium]
MLDFNATVLLPEATEQLIGWTRQAGEIALRHFKNINPRCKSDWTFLTEVDLEIERFLAERIRTAYPHHNLIGEEGVQNQQGQLSPNVWVIDPIDGTTAFVQGLPGWGVSVGLLDRGQPCFGLYYMPLLDDMTYLTSQGEVYCNKHDLAGTLRTDWSQKGFLAINAAAHYDFQINLKRTRALGSVSTNLVYTARGTATATFAPKAHLWDLVAGAAILTRVGGELRYLSGRPVDYLELLDGRLTPEPIIAGHPQVLAELPDLIRPHQPWR